MKRRIISDYSSYLKKKWGFRETLGRIVRGDYSFSSARGRALGYVPLAAIEQIKRVKCVVLARNTTSKYYHFMKLAIILYERVEI